MSRPLWEFPQPRGLVSLYYKPSGFWSCRLPSISGDWLHLRRKKLDISPPLKTLVRGRGDLSWIVLRITTAPWAGESLLQTLWVLKLPTPKHIWGLVASTSKKTWHITPSKNSSQREGIFVVDSLENCHSPLGWWTSATNLLGSEVHRLWLFQELYFT